MSKSPAHYNQNTHGARDYAQDGYFPVLVGLFVFSASHDLNIPLAREPVSLIRAHFRSDLKTARFILPVQSCALPQRLCCDPYWPDRNSFLPDRNTRRFWSWIPRL